MFKNEILENERIVCVVDSLVEMKDFIDSSHPYFKSKSINVIEIKKEEKKDEKYIEKINKLMDNPKENHIFFIEKEDKSLLCQLMIENNLLFFLDDNYVEYIKNRSGQLEKYESIKIIDEEILSFIKNRNSFKDFKKISQDEKNMIELYYSH